MEPLSIAASIVGLLTATAKISKTLKNFIGCVKNAPQLAEHVLVEVSNINASLTQVQNFLNSTNSRSQSRKQLVMMEQVVVILSTCVMAFSELESILESLSLEEPTKKLWARVAWTRQESSLKLLLKRLRWSKISLTLVLTTLTW